MTESGHSPHLLTGCQAYAALCEKLVAALISYPVVLRNESC